MTELEMLAAWIREYGSAEKLLRLHAPDDSGHCRTCAAGGVGTGKVLAPCSLYTAALAASAKERK